MTGETSLGATKFQFKSLGYLLFTGAVTGVLCFFILPVLIAQILQEKNLRKLRMRMRADED